MVVREGFELVELVESVGDPVWAAAEAKRIVQRCMESPGTRVLIATVERVESRRFVFSNGSEIIWFYLPPLGGGVD